MVTVRDEIARNIVFYRKKTKMTQSDLAKMIGYKKSAVSLWETGVNAIDTTVLLQICDVLGVGINDVLGIYAVDKNTLSQKEKEVAYAYRNNADMHRAVDRLLQLEYADYIEQNMITLRLYDIPAAAGMGMYLDHDGYTEIEVPENDIPHNAKHCVRIRGDSMEPEYLDDDIVYIEPLSVIANGQIGIFIVNSESYCKKLRIDHEHNIVYLVSLNPAYADMRIRDTDDFLTHGRVLGKVNRNK